MAASGGFARITTAATASVPTAATVPHYELSSRTTWGAFTTGFFWSFHAPTAGATAAIAEASGFTVTVWVRNPVTRRWAKFSDFTGVDFQEANVTYDCGPVELYFQIGSTTVNTAGSIDVEIMEQ